jgi:hypothetical protein
VVARDRMEAVLRAGLIRNRVPRNGTQDTGRSALT